jgi:hypothetical protein
MHDKYGIGEPVNDLDANGKGIESKATYLMQIFDLEKGHSIQRSLQHRRETPMIVHYSKDFHAIGEESSDKAFTQKNKKGSVPSVTVNSEIKVLPYLAKKGLLHVRLSNNQDHFDGSITPVDFDLTEFAR